MFGNFLLLCKYCYPAHVWVRNILTFDFWSFSRRWEWFQLWEKQRPCTCVMNFGTFLHRARPNHNVKWLNSRLCGEREHMTVNFSISVSTWIHLFCYWIVRPHCTSWANWNNRKVVQETRTYSFKRRFRWRCRCGFLKSLILSWRRRTSGGGRMVTSSQIF